MIAGAVGKPLEAAGGKLTAKAMDRWSHRWQHEAVGVPLETRTRDTSAFVCCCCCCICVLYFFDATANDLDCVCAMRVRFARDTFAIRLRFVCVLLGISFCNVSLMLFGGAAGEAGGFLGINPAR